MKSSHVYLGRSTLEAEAGVAYDCLIISNN
jgi:hypothetical protein